MHALATLMRITDNLEYKGAIDARGIRTSIQFWVNFALILPKVLSQYGNFIRMERQIYHETMGDK